MRRGLLRFLRGDFFVGIKWICNEQVSDDDGLFPLRCSFNHLNPQGTVVTPEGAVRVPG